MNTIYLDIETIPCQSPEYRAEVRAGIKPPGQYKKRESIDEWMAKNADAAADEIIAKTSLDPAYGHICMIGFAVSAEVCVLGATDTEGEATLIRDFFNALPTQGVNQFVGHNIASFDLSYILRRAIILGVKLPPRVSFPRQPKSWDDCVFDTMVAWCGPRGYIKQDALCKALGLPCKEGFDGSKVAKAWADGEHQKIADYCRSDVETVRQIHKRFMDVGY